MKFVRPILVACALGFAAASSMPAAARTAIGVSIGIAPPPPRVERVVALRPGYVWTGGYWRWTGRRHVWVAGYWLPARRGFVYERARWVRYGPDWRFRAGYWHRWH